MVQLPRQQKRMATPSADWNALLDMVQGPARPVLRPGDSIGSTSALTIRGLGVTTFDGRES